jgi:hypothetical protein
MPLVLSQDSGSSTRVPTKMATRLKESKQVLSKKPRTSTLSTMPLSKSSHQTSQLITSPVHGLVRFRLRSQESISSLPDLMMDLDFGLTISKSLITGVFMVQEKRKVESISRQGSMTSEPLISRMLEVHQWL